MCLTNRCEKEGKNRISNLMAFTLYPYYITRQRRKNRKKERKKDHFNYCRYNNKVSRPHVSLGITTRTLDNSVVFFLKCFFEMDFRSNLPSTSSPHNGGGGLAVPPLPMLPPPPAMVTSSGLAPFSMFSPLNLGESFRSLSF